MTKIKDIPIQDRPIERLLQYGAESISNEELLAILLRTGSKNQSSKELATTILSNIKQISDLKNISYEYLCNISDYYRNILSSKQQEHVYCLYLDSKKTIVKEKLLFIGTVNYSMVHPRDIFKEAYLASATSIICVHNHPTGDVMPSKEDYDMTNNLVQVGQLLGIPLIDHIIIGKHQYYSFFENGDINSKLVRNR